MCLLELVQEKNLIQNQICSYIRKELTNLMVAGENMAECATNIKGQGYASFITSRDAFRNVRKLQDEVNELNMHTH